MRMRVPAGEQEKRLDTDVFDSRLFELVLGDLCACPLLVVCPIRVQR
jgi:hypothetical protein